MSKDNLYTFGPFRLDLENGRILKHDQPVRWWSRRRYKLLKMLIDAQGHLVTYDSLITHAWDGKDIIIHTIAQTANDLRRCLGLYGDCIETHHGLGYSFKHPAVAGNASAAAELDLESLTYYGLALEEWNRRTENSLQRALTYFRRVLQYYPDFVPALLGLADCLTLLGHAGFPVYSPSQVIPEARSAIDRALLLSADAKTAAAAHTALGKIQLVFDWDWSQVEKSFNKAKSLDSEQAPIYHGFGQLFLISSRWQESLAAIDYARRLAPTSPMIFGTSGWLRYFMGLYDEAVDICRSVTMLHPQFPGGHVMLGVACEAAGHHADAAVAFETSNELQPSPVPLSSLGHLQGIRRKLPSARRVLHQLREMSRTRAVSPYHFALVHAGLGECDDALSCLEQAHTERFDWMIHLSVDPRWRVLHGRRRFTELLKRAGLYDFYIKQPDNPLSKEPTGAEG